MKWSWRSRQLAGIGVYMHGTFLLPPAWIVVISIGRGAGVWGARTAVLTACGVSGLLRQAMLGGSFLVSLFWVNVSPQVFNLPPVFPMNGVPIRDGMITRFRVPATQDSLATACRRTGDCLLS